MADPTLDAYLKALGFDEQRNLAGTQAEQQRGQVQAQYDLSVPELMRNTAQQQQNVIGDALGRGIFSSSEKNKNMADVNTNAQQQLARLNLSRDQGLQDIAMNLARQQSGFDVGQRTATYNFNQWLDAKNAAAMQAAQSNNSLNDFIGYLQGQLAASQLPPAAPAGGYGTYLPGYGPGTGNGGIGDNGVPYYLQRP